MMALEASTSPAWSYSVSRFQVDCLWLLEELSSVRRAASRWIVVIALIFSVGAHWAFIQSVAWLGMTVSYAQKAPLVEALTKTF